MSERLAELVGVAEAGRSMVDDIAARRAELAGTLSGRSPFRYAYLVWRRPWMAVSDDTFIAALLAEAGGRNAWFLETLAQAYHDTGRHSEAIETLREALSLLPDSGTAPGPRLQERLDRYLAENG